ncbi:MAG: DinB family protein, partial [Silvibacterium sp.]|nr:DinB family protein [Silvibacterium sp.]
LDLLEKDVVSAADAMPADKYEFAPSGTGEFKGVRSFGAQVKHLAEANYEFFDSWGLSGAVDPKTIEALKTKDDIMKALRDSFKYAHAAVDSITPENAFLSVSMPEQYKATRASMAAFCMAHLMDHYGQMVEYLRMNGIVPPATRQGNM